MSRYRDYFHDDRDCFCDDDEDRLPRGKAECPQCGDIVPEDHLDTDSGNCIGCEDRESYSRDEEEVYANCLKGYPFKKRSCA